MDSNITGEGYKIYSLLCDPRGYMLNFNFKSFDNEFGTNCPVLPTRNNSTPLKLLEISRPNQLQIPKLGPVAYVSSLHRYLSVGADMPAPSVWPEVSSRSDATREHLGQLQIAARVLLEAMSLNKSGKVPKDKIKALPESVIDCTKKGRKQPAPDDVQHAQTRIQPQLESIESITRCLTTTHTVQLVVVADTLRKFLHIHYF